jgi:hypothetical protein
MKIYCSYCGYIYEAKKEDQTRCTICGNIKDVPTYLMQWEGSNELD